MKLIFKALTGLVLALTLSACATTPSATRSAMPDDAVLGFSQPDVRIDSFTVSVPKSLKVNERNTYYPIGDIVWRGDPMGDRHAQVKAMFEAGLSLARDPELAAGSARAQAVLERAAAGLADRLPEGKRPPAAMFSAHVWAMSHGVVELFARGSPGTRAPFPPEELLESGIGIYLRGLGLIEPDE